MTQKLTAQQRYRQACVKARIRGQRNLRKFLAGEIDILPCSDPRPDIIAEIERAYMAGLRDGSKAGAQQ